MSTQKLAFTLTLSILGLHSLHSQTWDGDTDNDWNTNANWATDPAYPNSTTSDVTFSDIAGTNLSPNISSAVTVRDITFTTTTDAYSIGGSTINLSANSDITQSGSTSTTVSANLDANSNNIGLGGNGTGTLSLTGTLTSNNTITKTGTSTFYLNGVDNSSTLGNSTKWVVNDGTLQFSHANSLGAPTSSSNDYITLNGGTLASYSTGSALNLDKDAGITIGASGGTIDVSGTKSLVLLGSIYGSGDTYITNSAQSGGQVVLRGDNSSYTGDFHIGNGGTVEGDLRIDNISTIPSGSDIIFNMDTTVNRTASLIGNESTGLNISNNLVIRRKSTAGQIWNAELKTVDGDLTLSGNITTDTTDGSQNHDSLFFHFAQGSNHNITISGNNNLANINNFQVRNTSTSGSQNTLYLNSANALNGFTGTGQISTIDANTSTRVLSQISGADYTFDWDDQDGATVGANATFTLGGANSSGTVTYSGNITYDDSSRNGTTQYLHAETAGSKTTFSGVINDGAQSIALSKTGAGEVILSNANTFDGGFTVSAGTVFANNGSGSATGTGSVSVANGSSLVGSGSISGQVTVDTGGHIAAGSDFYTVGNLNITHTGSDNTINGNASGTYIWNVEDFSGAAGTAWDILSFTGSVNFTNTSGVYKIYIESLSSAGTLGLANNQSASGSLKILDTASVGSFKLGGATASNALLDSFFEIDESGFLNANANWWLTTDGQALYLNYYEVPEPGTWVGIIGLSFFIFVHVLKKRFLSVSNSK